MKKMKDTKNEAHVIPMNVATNPQRKYKDRLFRMIFWEKRELLSLYNAVNGTDYEDSEELTINTLEKLTVQHTLCSTHCTAVRR